MQRDIPHTVLQQPMNQRPPEEPKVPRENLLYIRTYKVKAEKPEVMNQTQERKVMDHRLTYIRSKGLL